MGEAVYCAGTTGRAWKKPELDEEAFTEPMMCIGRKLRDSMSKIHHQQEAYRKKDQQESYA